MTIRFLYATAAAAALILGSFARSASAADYSGSYAYSVISLNVVNQDSGKTLRGRLYKPLTEGKVPLVITAHELGSNFQRRWPQYGEYLAARGLAVYTFDFAGGGPKVRADGDPGNISDGETTELSVMTEVKDLESVLASSRKWNFVDAENISVIGGSQGGAVSVIAAARHPDELKGLVLLYPGLLIKDDLHKKFKSKEECPPVYKYNGWLDVSPIYVKDMWDYDLYADMSKFPRPVLILHGDQDSIVPVKYSEKAAEKYPDAELYTVKGGQHGFQGESFKQAMEYIEAYFQKVGVMKK